MPTPSTLGTFLAIGAQVHHAGGPDSVPWLQLDGHDGRRLTLRLDGVLAWHLSLHELVRVDTVNGSYEIGGGAAVEVDGLLTQWLIDGPGLSEDFPSRG